MFSVTLISNAGALSFLKSQDVPKLPTTADETAPPYETINRFLIFYYMPTFRLKIH